MELKDLDTFVRLQTAIKIPGALLELSVMSAWILVDRYTTKLWVSLSLLRSKKESRYLGVSLGLSTLLS